MPPTYVTLANNSALVLTNRSEAPVEFRWRAFASEEEEAVERQRRIAELDEQYAIEVCFLRVTCLFGPLLHAVPCNPIHVLPYPYPCMRRKLL